VSSCRFLLDEHIESYLWDSIWRLRPEIEVFRLGSRGAPPLGSTDEALLVSALTESLRPPDLARWERQYQSR
jgi:hypothetical protein